MINRRWWVMGAALGVGALLGGVIGVGACGVVVVGWGWLRRHDRWRRYASALAPGLLLIASAVAVGGRLAGKGQTFATGTIVQALTLAALAALVLTTWHRSDRR